MLGLENRWSPLPLNPFAYTSSSLVGENLSYLSLACVPLCVIRSFDDVRTYYANAIEVFAMLPDLPVVLCATKCDDTARRGATPTKRQIGSRRGKISHWIMYIQID